MTSIQPQSLPTDLTLGPVHLVVSDLSRSLAFYTQAIGLELREADDGTASLGVGERELLVLLEEPGARPSTGSAGLFHFALRAPTRAALARWLAHAARTGVPITGLSDHFVSEAIYLDDPDAHGIEIYCDRPRALWDGQVAQRLTTMPLDVDDLLRELGDGTSSTFDGLTDGTDMGHVHLRVGSVPEAVGFYESILGFDVVATLPQAAFFSVGGYHHHLGANTWQSRGAVAAPTGYARLHHATIVLSERMAVDVLAARVEEAGYEVEPRLDGVRVRDPFGTAIEIESRRG